MHGSDGLAASFLSMTRAVVRCRHSQWLPQRLIPLLHSGFLCGRRWGWRCRRNGARLRISGLWLARAAASTRRHSKRRMRAWHEASPAARYCGRPALPIDLGMFSRTGRLESGCRWRLSAWRFVSFRGHGRFDLYSLLVASGFAAGGFEIVMDAWRKSRQTIIGVSHPGFWMRISAHVVD